jgi:hypothetical protein
MKTTLAILFLCFGLGCRPDIHTNPPKVVTVEGCEYFQLPAYPGGFYTLCHKGNCTNHIYKGTP